MGSYSFSQDAEADLDRIWLYGYKQWGEQQADAYYWDLIKHFEALTAQPLLYPAIEHIRPGYRKSVCGGETVYYRLTGTGIRIERILGRQHPETQL